MTAQNITHAISLHDKKIIEGTAIIDNKDVNATITIDGITSQLEFSVNDRNDLDKITYPFVKFIRNDVVYFLQNPTIESAGFTLGTNGATFKYKCNYFDMIQSASNFKKFRGANVVFSGISKWLGDNSFSVSVELNGWICKIQTIKMEADEHAFQKIIQISFDHEIDINEIKNTILKLRTFFSILVGTAIFIDYVWLAQNETSFPAFLLFFNNEKPKDFSLEKIENLINPIVKSSYLKDKMLYVLSNFLIDKNKVFLHIGTRIFSSLSHECYWDIAFHNLLCLSEGYADLLSVENDDNQSEKDRNSTLSIAKKTAKKELSSYLNSPSFEETVYDKFRSNVASERLRTSFMSQKNLIIEVLENGLAQSRFATTFNKRLTRLFERIATNTILCGIFKFSPNDFQSDLKNYRDTYAHSDFIKFPQDDEEIRKAILFHKKLLILLIFSLYEDMGINVFDLIKYSGSTFVFKNIIRENYYLFFDEVEIARIDGSLFISIDSDTYKMIKPMSFGTFLVFMKKQEQYKYSPSNTSIISENWPGKTGYPHVSDYLANIVNKSVTYKYCYLECRGEPPLKRQLLIVSSD